MYSSYRLFGKYQIVIARILINEPNWVILFSLRCTPVQLFLISEQKDYRFSLLDTTETTSKDVRQYFPSTLYSLIKSRHVGQRLPET